MMSIALLRMFSLNSRDTVGDLHAYVDFFLLFSPLVIDDTRATILNSNAVVMLIQLLEDSSVDVRKRAKVALEKFSADGSLCQKPNLDTLSQFVTDASRIAFLKVEIFTEIISKIINILESRQDGAQVIASKILSQLLDCRKSISNPVQYLSEFLL